LHLGLGIVKARLEIGEQSRQVQGRITPVQSELIAGYGHQRGVIAGA